VADEAWLHAEEHGEIRIPLDRLVKNGGLDVYPEILEQGLFKVFFRGDQLIFQAGGWIGMLHINKELVIEVTSRVPIANLEWIIARSHFEKFIVLDAFRKDFSLSNQQIPSIINIMADRLTKAVEAIQFDSLHYEYVSRQYIGSFPRGRIDPPKTALHRLRLGQSPQSVFEAWERTVDVLPNQYIRHAIRKLLHALEGAPNKAGRRSRITALRKADDVFDRVSLPSTRPIDIQNLIRRVPASKPVYKDALVVSHLILEDSGIELRSTGGSVSLAPILVLMENVFERYVRKVLVGSLTQITCRNGNLQPPEGAKKLLGTADALSPFKIQPVTPDIVFYDGARPIMVADVKYKIIKDFPQRDDVNQVLTYALSYGCERAGLFYPRRSPHSPAGMIKLGTVGSVLLYAFFVDLSSTDLSLVENMLCSEVERICKQ